MLQDKCTVCFFLQDNTKGEEDEDEDEEDEEEEVIAASGRGHRRVAGMQSPLGQASPVQVKLISSSAFTPLSTLTSVSHMKTAHSVVGSHSILSG